MENYSQAVECLEETNRQREEMNEVTWICWLLLLGRIAVLHT